MENEKVHLIIDATNIVNKYPREKVLGVLTRLAYLAGANMELTLKITAVPENDFHGATQEIGDKILPDFMMACEIISSLFRIPQAEVMKELHRLGSAAFLVQPN